MAFCTNRFLLLLAVAPLLWGQGNRVPVSRFGAVPDDNADDTPALRKAVEYARQNPGTVLYFAPGVYDLRDEAAVQLMNDVMSGKMGQNPEKAIFTRYYP